MDYDLSDLEAAAARPPVDGPPHDETVEPQDADERDADSEFDEPLDYSDLDPGPQAPIAGVGQAFRTTT